MKDNKKKKKKSKRVSNFVNNVQGGYYYIYIYIYMYIVIYVYVHVHVCVYIISLRDTLLHQYLSSIVPPLLIHQKKKK